MVDRADASTLLEAAETLRPQIVAERERVETGTELAAAHERPAASHSVPVLDHHRLSRRECAVAEDRVGRAEDLLRHVMAGGEATIEGRSLVRLASWHAVTSAAQAVDLVYLTGGATSLYEACPLERAFRDVHAITQHIGVHPRALEITGRVFFGLDPEMPAMAL